MESLNRDLVYRGFLANVDYVTAGEQDGNRWVTVGKINTSNPVGTAATGLIGWQTVASNEAITLGKQGVDKALGLSSHKATTTKHLSNNATKVKLSEISAGHAAPAPAP